MVETENTDTFDKLQANLNLGLGSNFFTIGGFLAAWIMLERTGWVDDWWHKILVAFSLIPVFMGDALNAYFLGRIRLERDKGWLDVQMTPEGKDLMVRFYYFWRGLSLTTTALLALILLCGHSPDPARWKWLSIAFPVIFLVHFLRGQYTVVSFYGPLVPTYTLENQKKKIALLLLVSSTWLYWLYQREPGPFSNWSCIGHGMVFFFLNSFLHPVPSKFSLFRLHDSGKPRVLEKVELLETEQVDFVQAPEMVAELSLWEALGFSRNIGSCRMPLLELPIFHAVGQAFVSEEQRCVLLLLKTDLRPRPHRTLLSWAGDRIYITTDFGAPDARFPGEVTYANLPLTSAPEPFLKEHRARIPGTADPVQVPPWGLMNDLFDKMRAFLRRPSTEQISLAAGEKT